MSQPPSNGRVDILQRKSTQPPDISALFNLYDKIPANQCTTFRDPTAGQWDQTELSVAYFSAQNIQIIQNAIRAGVYSKSNGQYLIAPQDCDVLKIIMRSIFLQNSVNKPTHINLQVKALNQLVVDYCILHVYSEAQGYLKYLHDASTLVEPLALPVMSEQNGKRVHKLKAWV